MDNANITNKNFNTVAKFHQF